ncbi:MAG: hypothetical protein LBK60_03380, partial [Verrucomicrobiales bacterium]|nr:hypothetical protein [Verrucomicrobiales bacterium]
MSDFDPIKAGAILVEDEPFDPIKVGAVLIDDEPFDPIKVGAIEVDGALSELETKAGMALKWAQEQSNGLLDNRLTPYHHLQKNRSPYGADADAVATRLMRDNLRAEVRKLNPEMTEAGIDTELARGTGLMDWVGGAFKTLGKTGAQSLAYGAELGGFMLESGAEYMRKLMRGLAGIPATDYAARAQKRETYRRETRDYYVNKLGRSEEEAGRLTNQLVDKFFPEQRANVKEAYDLAYRYRRQTEQQPWATDDPHTPNVVKTVSSAIAQGIPQLLSLVSYKIPGLGPMVALKDVLSESYNQLRTDSEQSGKNLSEDELIDAAMSSAAFKALFEVGMDKFALKGISGLFGKKASGAVTAELAKETAKKEAQKGFVRRAAEAYLKQQAVEQPTELIQDYSDKFFGARLGLEQDWYSWAELRDRTLSVAFMPQGAVAAVGEARARQNNLPLTAEALKQQHQQFQEKIRAATNGFYRGEDTVDQAAKKMRQAGFSDTDIQIWRNRLTTPALAVNSDGGMRQQDSQPLYGADGKINSDAALTIAGIDFSNGLITLDEATAVNERFQGKELAEEFRKIMLPYVNEQGYYDQKGRERAAADAVGAEIEGENNPGAPTVTADGEQPSAPDNPVPESDATVAVQMDWLNKGKRDAVFFTPGTTIPATPEGLARLDTARGTFIYNPLVHSEESLNNAVKNDTLGDVLGYGIPRKPSDANIAGVIVLRGTDGTEKLSVVTDDAHRQQVEDNLNALAEEGDTVTLEPTEDKVLAERREQLSRQFPGVDWRNKPVPATPQKSSPASGNFQTAWEKTARLLTPIGGTVRRVNAPAKSSGFEAWFTLDEHGHPQVYVGVDEAMVNSHRQKFQNEEEFNEWVNRAFNEEYLHAADLESLRRKWEAGGSAGGFHEFLNHERAKLWRGLSEADRRMIEAIYGDFDPKATDAQKAQELLRILLQLQRDGKLTEFAGRLSAPGRSALRAWLQQLADFIKNTLRAANNTELQTALDEINAVLAEVDAALKEQSPTTNSESNITVSGEEINAVGDAPFAAAPHGGESVAKLERVRNAVRAVAEGAEEGVARNLRPDLVIYGGSADVVFPWGNDRFGLKKIATRRGAEVLNQVLRTVALGEVERHGDTKKTVNLALGDYRAVLSLDEHGKQKTWLLTGWEEGRPDATGEVSAQTEATQPTPTFSRDRLGAGLNDIIDTERRSVNSKSTAAGDAPFAAAPERRLPSRAVDGSISRMSDPARVAQDNRTSFPVGEQNEATRKAANGQPSNLTAAEYARATSPEFKARYGDWEALAKINAVRNSEPLKVNALATAPSEREVKNLFSTFGEIKNDKDGRQVIFPNRTVGKILRHRGFNVGRIAKDLPVIFRRTIPAWSENYQAKPGHKDHSSNIKAYHNYVGKFADGEATYFIRFTLHEENKHRGDGKNNLHSTFISDVEIYRQKQGADFARVHVSNMGVVKGAPYDEKLSRWLSSVNPQNIKIPLDENGEPVMSAIDQSHPNATRPNGGTPLFAAAPERRLPRRNENGSISRMSDPQRAANQHNRTSPAGGLSEAAPRLAANGQTSNLTAAEYARA